jgi:cell shape-determining protein MreC
MSWVDGWFSTVKDNHDKIQNKDNHDKIQNKDDEICELLKKLEIANEEIKKLKSQNTLLDNMLYVSILNERRIY